MDGWSCSRLESNEDKAVDEEDERWRVIETGCWGGQGSPRTVGPRGWMDNKLKLTKKNLSLYPLLKCDNMLRTKTEFRPIKVTSASFKSNKACRISVVFFFFFFFWCKSQIVTTTWQMFLVWSTTPVYIFVSFNNWQYCTVFVPAVCLCRTSCNEPRSVTCDTWRLFWRLPTTSCIEWLSVFEVIQKLKAESMFSDVIQLIESCAAQRRFGQRRTPYTTVVP